METFAAAKRQFRLHLRPDEVRIEARWPAATPALEEVQQALTQLVEWGNLQFVMRSFKARPWRFGSVDYFARSGRRLNGTTVCADWDAELAPKMAEHGYALDEEAVIDSLLQDLARA